MHFYDFLRVILYFCTYLPVHIKKICYVELRLDELSIPLEAKSFFFVAGLPATFLNKINNV